MSHIRLSNIDKFYGKNHVLRDLSLEIEDKEFMTFLGPSGCGKTTTLRVIAGLEKPERGQIYIRGKEAVNAEEQFFLPASQRGLNLVFQSYALWPHMTVFQNVAFTLKVQKLPRAAVRERVLAALRQMKIAEYEARYPGELSGGQQQRVAIARAIVSEQSLLLLDEPLSNLDAKLRLEMRSELKRLHQELGTTMIYVTHDQVEALTLSTRIAVFFDGSIEQLSTPDELYHNPATLRVAEFIGNPKINFLPGRLVPAGDSFTVDSALGSFTLPSDRLTALPGGSAAIPCVLGVRPEQITISREPGGVRGKILSAMPAGSETLTEVALGETVLLAKELGTQWSAYGEEVRLTVDPEEINLFSERDGRLIKRAVRNQAGRVTTK